MLSIVDCLNAGKHGVSISNEEYHALDGISGSNLKLLEISNKHLDEKRRFTQSASCFDFGTLVHTIVLEPDDVEKRYVIMPKFTPKQGTTLTAQKEDFIALYSDCGKSIIDLDDFRRATKMAENCLAIYGDIISAGVKERSIFSSYEGMIIKCRLDIQLGRDDYDLKTISLGAKDFNERTIEAHIRKCGYHISAAFRNFVREQAGDDVGGSFLMFVDSGGAHIPRMVEIRPSIIAEAREKVLDMLFGRLTYLASKGKNDTQFMVVC